MKNKFECTGCGWKIGTNEKCDPEEISCVFCGSDMKREDENHEVS